MSQRKHLTLLLGGALLSSCEVFGDLESNLAQTSDENVFASTSLEVKLQQLATINTVAKMLNNFENFSQKSDAEKERFIKVYSAIILTSGYSNDALKVTTENQQPTLEITISDKIKTVLTQTLTSTNAEEIWNDATSIHGPQQHLLYTSARPNL